MPINPTGYCDPPDPRLQTLAEENAALRKEVERLTAELHPPGKYRCGCPIQRSDKIKLFCDTHMEMIADTPEVPK